MEAIGRLICSNQQFLAQLIDRGAQLGWRETCVRTRQLIELGLDLLWAGGGGDGLPEFGELAGRLAALLLGSVGDRAVETPAGEGLQGDQQQEADCGGQGQAAEGIAAGPQPFAAWMEDQGQGGEQGTHQGQRSVVDQVCGEAQLPLAIQDLEWPGSDDDCGKKDPQHRQRHGLQNTGKGRIAVDGGGGGGWGFGLHEWMDSRTMKLIDHPEPNRPIDHSARHLPDG